MREETDSRPLARGTWPFVAAPPFRKYCASAGFATLHVLRSERSNSSLSPPATKSGARSQVSPGKSHSIQRSATFDLDETGRGTGGHGRARALEGSNLPAPMEPFAEEVSVTFRHRPCEVRAGGNSKTPASRESSQLAAVVVCQRRNRGLRHPAKLWFS